jgi:AraC family transcriptional regulator of adaptative response/methylated-DNA-[protein]-cysteine methyltransferase
MTVRGTYFTAMKHHHYQIIEKAILFLADNYKNQPNLSEVAAAVFISPQHLQRIFTKWVGISPKQFLSHITIQNAKRMLQANQSTLSAAYDVGLSGNGRLHDQFIRITAMSPGEFKAMRNGLQITMSMIETPFGNAIVGETIKGVCHMAFADNLNSGHTILQKDFPGAQLIEGNGRFAMEIADWFSTAEASMQMLPLHLRGTPFQIKIWEALLRIPYGQLKTYQSIASDTGNPQSARAVGNAIARNPVAYLIPCHRVIKSTGYFGNYRWHSARKKAIIGFESVKSHT